MVLNRRHALVTFIFIQVAWGDFDLYRPFTSHLSPDPLNEHIAYQLSNLTTEFEEPGSNALLARQSRCRPGSSPCGSFCCAVGKVCQRDGCCDAGELQCGTSGCYNPSTSVCCGSDSHYCPKGYDCIAGTTKCCPSGQVPCGNSDKCYNPTMAKCCQSGGQVWPCGLNQECCNGGYCAYTGTEQCCTNGVCPQGDTCCTTQCCRSMAYCAADGVCRARETPTPPSNPPTPARPPSVQTATQTITFVYKPNRKVVIKEGPLKGQKIDAPPKSVMMNMCRGIASYSGSTSQTMKLDRVDETKKEKNRSKMCPDGTCAKAVAEYVQKFYPSGIPKQAEEALLVAGDLQCDEFPFATSAQGGDPDKGVVWCLPGTENGWQGGTMSNYFKEFTRTGRRNSKFIDVGHSFVIKIVGWNCKTQMPDPSIKKRDLSPPGRRNSALLETRDFATLGKRDAFGASGVNFTAEEMYEGFDDSDENLNLMAMPLGDLKAGSYSVDLKVTGGSLDLTLTDNEGGDYNMTSNADGTVTFQLPRDVRSASLIGVTPEKNIEVTYHAKTVESKKSGAIQLVSQAFLPIGLFVINSAWHYF